MACGMNEHANASAISGANKVLRWQAAWLDRSCSKVLKPVGSRINGLPEYQTVDCSREASEALRVL